MSQLPALRNGCEATALAMLLASQGRKHTPGRLAAGLPRDYTPVTFRPGSRRGLLDVTSWGDPEVGFVGNVEGYIGYGIYHRPLARYLDRLLPGRAVDLTGQPIQAALDRVAAGAPVVLWTTVTLRPTDTWVTWQAPGGRVRATPDEHAVLLVGYDRRYFYVNDPLTGAAARRVNRESLLASWQQLGQQALSVN